MTQYKHSRVSRMYIVFYNLLQVYNIENMSYELATKMTPHTLFLKSFYAKLDDVSAGLLHVFSFTMTNLWPEACSRYLTLRYFKLAKQRGLYWSWPGDDTGSFCVKASYSFEK